MLRFQLIDMLGYSAAVFNIYAAVSRTMIRLRTAAMAGNALALCFALYNGLLPNVLVNAVVLPLNGYRLVGMLKQIRDVKQSSEGQFNIEWLRPFMAEKMIADGTTIFTRGDLADRAYYISSGEILLPDIAVTLRAGELFGEMGLMSEGNRRSQTAVARGAVQLLSISYSDFRELAIQNPEFGFYLMRLIMQRLEANQSIRQAIPA